MASHVYDRTVRRSFAWPRRSAVLALGALLGLSAVSLGLLLIFRSLESAS